MHWSTVGVLRWVVMKVDVCPSPIVIWYQLTPGCPRKMVIIISIIIKRLTLR